MDIGDIKGKTQLYLIDHLSMLKEKEYPYNYNEISEVIDKLADIFYGEDCEKEKQFHRRITTILKIPTKSLKTKQVTLEIL